MSQIKNKFLAQVPADTLKGNNTGSTANPTDLTVSQVQTLLSIPTASSPLAVGSGGTGLTTLTANNVILGNGSSSPTFVAPGTNGNILTSNGTTWQSEAPGAAVIQVAVFNNTQTSGTLSGTGVGMTWTQRVLNTTQQSQSWASLSSNQITLTAGTYYVEATSPFFSVAQCQERLYNVTDSVVALGGSSEYAGTLNQARSNVIGQISVSGSKTFELDYYMSATGGTGQDLGAAASTGSNEIYSIISITKVG